MICRELREQTVRETTQLSSERTVYFQTFIKDRRFCCNEQFYYYSKACHAKDYTVQVEIMANDDLGQIQRIDKRVGGSDSDWIEINEAVHAPCMRDYWLNSIIIHIYVEHSSVRARNYPWKQIHMAQSGMWDWTQRIPRYSSTRIGKAKINFETCSWQCDDMLTWR